MFRAVVFLSLICAGLPQAGAQSQPAADVPPAAAEGGPRRWQAAVDTLVLREERSDAAPEVGAVAEGTLLSNQGCAMVEDRVWCEVRSIRGKLRGYAAAQDLRPARGADGVVPMGVDDSARRAARRDFDARGEILCAQIRGQQMQQCSVGVARGRGGDATVVVSFPNGFKRSLSFVHGEFISANATMSGVGTDVDWQLDGGLHRIRVEDQRYEIDHALIFGG